MHYRTQLFVPGNRSDRFEKACQSKADLVCIDLEDAVAPAEKAKARSGTIQWLGSTDHSHVSLRINGFDSPYVDDDIRALADSNLTLPFIMIPKVANLDDLDRLNTDLPSELGKFFVIIESAAGLVNCEEIFAHPRVQWGMFGFVDYAGDVGCDMDWEALLYARSRLAAAAVAHKTTLFEGPHINVRDLDDCEDSTRRAKAMGFHARSAIHPAQINRILSALAPTDDEVAWAKEIIAADEASGGNVTLVNGKFIEAPVVKRATRIIDAAARG